MTASSLARYVTPSLSEERVTAQWSGSLVVARQLGRERRARAVLALGAICLAAALIVLPWRRGGEGSAVAGTRLESGPSELQRLSLPDGTRVELAAGTELALAELDARRVRLRLERGGVMLDVATNPRRELVIEAARTEVLVVGTRFRVVAGTVPGEPRVTVAVERGAVRVRSLDGGGETQLTAGQSWTDPTTVAGPIAAAPLAAVAPPPGPVVVPDGGATPEAAVAPSSASAPPPPEPDPKASFAALGPAGFARAAATSGPGRLFELYEQAQLAGRPAEAATALDQLRRRFPGDARAGLAAFELGRLRQDQLGDPAGAAAALEDAVRRGGAFGEDAAARLVRAYQALGNRAACERTRDAYLARYPRGAHSEAVKRGCRR